MAKNVAHVNAIIDLAVKGTKEAQRQLEQIGGVKEKITKDNKIQYIIDVNDEKMLQLKQIKDQLDLKDKNLMKIGIDENSFNGSKKAVQEFVTWLKTTLESVKVGDIVTSGSGGISESSIQKEIDAQKNKLKELRKVLGEQKKIYEDQARVIDDANNKINSTKNVDISTYAKDVVSKYNDLDKAYIDNKSDKEIEAAMLNLEKSFESFVVRSKKYGDLAALIKEMPGADKYEKKGEFDNLLHELGSFYFDNNKKEKNDFINKFNTKKGFEDLQKYYKETSNYKDDEEIINSSKQTIDTALKMQNEASSRIKDLESQINSLQFKIKTLEDSAKKSVAKTTTTTTTATSKSAETASETTSYKTKVSNEVVKEIESRGIANIKVKPDNLDGFYKEIESHKDAHIKVTLDNTDITRRNKDKKLDTLNIVTKLDISKSLQNLKTTIQDAINPIELTVNDKNIGNIDGVVDNIKSKIGTDNVMHNQIDSLVEGLKGKYKSEENILTQIRGIINTAKDSSIGKLTQEQKGQIVALSKLYEDKTGKDFNSILSELGVRQNAKYLDGVKKDIAEYQNYLKEKAITVPVELELNKTSLEKLENQVKNSLSNVEINLNIDKAKRSINDLKAEWKAVQAEKEVAEKKAATKDTSNVTVTKRIMPIDEAYKKNLKNDLEDYIKQYADVDEKKIFERTARILKTASDSGKQLDRVKSTELAALDAVYKRKTQKDSAVQTIVEKQKIDSGKILENYKAISELWDKKPNNRLLNAIKPTAEAQEKVVDDKSKKVPVEIVVSNESDLIAGLKKKIGSINPIDLTFKPTNLDTLKKNIEAIFNSVSISFNAFNGKNSNAGTTLQTGVGFDVSPLPKRSKTVVSNADQKLFDTFDTMWSQYSIKTEYEIYDKIAAIFRGNLKRKDPQLSSKDAAKVASLKELYKLVSGKSSPVSDILKSLGVENFDTLLKKNYSDAKKSFDKWSEIRSSNKSSTSTATTTATVDSGQKQRNTGSTSIAVSMELVENAIPSLKTKIQAGINPIAITLKPNVKTIKDDIVSAIGNVNFNVDPKLSNSNISSIGNIVKQMAEADSFMKEHGSTRFERSLLFNTKTGYVGNPFVHGKRNSVPISLFESQKEVLTDSVNAFLHTHPSGNATPSAGDLSVYAKELQNGITQQFIATMKEVLHFNFDNVKQKDLSNISAKYAEKIEELRRIDDDYKITNKDVNATFNALNEKNAEKLKGSFINILKNQKGFDPKTMDGIADSFYLNFKNALSNNFLKNKDGFFNTDDFINANLDKIFADKNLLSKNKTSLAAGLERYVSSLLGYVKKPVDENMAKEVSGHLRTLFKNRGYDPNEIMKTYSIDEFEKKFGVKASVAGQAGVKQEASNTTVPVSLKANIETFRNELSTITPPPIVNVDLKPNVEKLKAELQTVGGLTANVAATPVKDATSNTAKSNEAVNVNSAVAGEIEGVKGSINNLVTSITGIGTAFIKQTSRIGNTSKTQIAHINNVKAAVEELNGVLNKSINSDSIKSIDLSSQLEQIRIEREELTRLREELTKQKEDPIKQGQASGSKKDKTSKDLTEYDRFLKGIDKMSKTSKYAIDKNSFKQLEDGTISFTSSLKKANGEIEYLEHKAKSIKELTGTKGGFLVSELNNSGKSFIDPKQLQEYGRVMEELKLAEAYTSYDNKYVINDNKNITGLKEKAITMEKELGTAVEATNLSETRKKEILEEINKIKNKEYKGFTLAADDSKNNKVLNDLKLAKNAVFNSVDASNIIGDRSVFTSSGQYVDNVKLKVQELQTTIENQMNILETGTFKNEKAFNQMALSIKNNINLMKELGSSHVDKGSDGYNYITDLFTGKNLRDIDQRDIRSSLGDMLNERYRKILDLKYDSGKKTATGRVVNYDGEVEKIVLRLKEYKRSADETSTSVSMLNNVEGKYVNNVGKWVQGFKSRLSTLTQYITGMQIIHRSIYMARQGFQFVKELDANMTTIYQTMDITTEELGKLSSGAIKAAKDLGALSTQMIESINIYAAYGKTYQQILEQAKPTVMLANAAGSSAEEASDYIQAVIQQYEELEGQETRIVNSYEKIAANVQIDFDKGIRSISEGVQNAGSVMNEAGVDFELYAASLAKVAERTRLEGSQIGNAMKTIASRISRSKTGDEDVTAAERSNASKAYGSIGIDVYNDDGSYRGLATILDELAAKWDTLTDAQRNYVAEQSAGVRNINIFNTMLDTWGEAKELAADANEDTDYYLEVQEKWMDSMTAKMNTLKSSLQEFWYGLIDTGAVNLIVESLTAVIKLCEMVVKAFRNIGSIFGETGAAVGGLVGAITIVMTAASAVDKFRRNPVTGKRDGFKGMTKSLRQYINSLKEYIVLKKTATSVTNENTVSQKANNAAEVEGAATSTAEAAAEGTEAIATQADTTADIANTTAQTASNMAEATGAATSLGDAVANSLSLVAKFSKVMKIASFAIPTVAILGSVVALGLLTDSTKETTEKIEELNKAYEESQTKLKSNKSTIDSIKDEFEELSKGVAPGTGKNISLTTDEYARYQEICNQIADMYPDLVKSYDTQGNAILNLKGKVEGLADAYDRQRLAAANTTLYGEDGDEDNLKTYIENFKNLNNQRSAGTKAWDSLWDFGDAEIGGDITAGEVVDGLEEIKSMNYDQIKEWINKQRVDNANLLDWMSNSKNLGLDIDYKGVRDSATGELTAEMTLTEDQWYETARKIPELIGKVNTNVNKATTSLKQGLQEYLTVLELGDTEFANVDSSVFEQVSSLISTMTRDQIKNLTARGVELEAYVEDLVTKLSNSASAQTSLDNILNLGDDATIEDVRKALEEDFETLVDELNIATEDLPGLKIQLGLDGKDDVLKEYDDTVKYIEEKFAAEHSVDKLAKESKEHGGNVDIYDRPIIAAGKMQDAGWSDFDNEELATYYSSSYSNKDESKTIVLTPILPNGEVLTPEELDKYASDMLEGKEVDANILLGTWEGKDSVKNSTKFAKNLSKASDEFDLQKRDSRKIRDYIKSQNLYTTKELVLLRNCAITAKDISEALDNFEFKNSLDTDNNVERLNVLKDNLTVVNEDIEKIDEAIESSNSSMGLSAEQIDNIKAAFSDLEGYDYDKLFESTAEGVHLNAQELAKLNGEYSKVHSKKYAKELERLEDQYANLCIAIEEETDTLERNNLISKRNTVAEQIDECRELQSMYEGLTNAVSEYLRVKERGEDGDTFKEIAEDWEEMDKNFARHEVGTDKFRAYTQMWTNQDISQMTPAEVAKIYGDARIDKMNRYLTFNDDDELIDTGIHNFLTDLNKKDSKLASLDGNGNWIIDIDVDKAAEMMDLSEALVTELYKMATDFGAVLAFGEETEDLRNLRQEAQEAANVFSDKEAYRLDLTISDEDALKNTIKDSEKLRKELVDAFGESSKEVKAFDKQVDYLEAKLGEVAETEYVVDIHSDEGIKELEKSLETLSNKGVIDLDISWDNKDPKYWDDKLSALKTSITKLQDEEGNIDINASGAKEALQLLRAINISKREASEDVILDIDTSNLEGSVLDATVALQNIQTLSKDLEDRKYEAELGFDVDVEAAEQKLIDAVAIFKEEHKSFDDLLIKAGVELNPEGTATDIQNQLNSIDTKVLVDVDPSLVDGYVDEEKTASGTVVWDNDTSVVDSYAKIDKSATGTVYWKNNTDNVKTNFNTQSSSSNVPKSAASYGYNGMTRLHGTAYADGTNGDWGAEKDEVALVGEVAPELRVNSKTGRWELLGKDGAEFAKINKNDIIFNGKQTEELFKNGRVTSGGGRGRAFINGTIGKLNSLFRVGSGSAYNDGSNISGYWDRGDIHNIVKDSLSRLSNKDSDSSAADEFKETIDWVEIMIDRLERKIQDLDTIANSAYKKFSKRNSTLAKEFGKVSEEITLQQKAYNTYMAKANSVGLSETYKKKVRDGKLQIEDITDEKLKEKIDDYQTWYEKALDCKYAITDLNEQLGDLAKAKFDNVQAEFDELIAKVEDTIELNEGGLDLVEARGQFASRKYFETLMSTEKENIKMIEKEYVALQNAYNEAMNTGAIEVGSEAYYEMQQQIRDTEKALQDANVSLIQYKNDMWEMDWSAFEYGQDLISKLTEESQFLIDLLSLNENDLFSKVSGKLTDSGFSVAGLHAVDYNVYMSQAEEYEKKMKEVNAELAKDPTNTILIDKKNEYIEAQREAIRNANDEKMAVRDLIEESYNRMLEILQELIDKRKEALQAEKDLYSYEKNVAEQTKQITDYQKQLSALAGDDSEETKSKRQQLQTSLEEAQEGLRETEYDQWLSDQEKLMDKMYEDYETILNERLDNVDGLLLDIIEATNNNSETIGNTINSAADKVGYDLTEGMTGIWNTTDSGVGKVVSDFNTNFTTTLTTTNEYIKKVYELINKNVKNADKDYTDNTKPGSTVKEPTKKTSGGSGDSKKGSGGSNKTSGGSGSSNKGSFFVYKKDNYPKSQLNISQSIIDRLKYNNFDTSWSNMAMYYEKMGLGSRSSYVGSYQQNVNMLNWMKKNGFRQSGQLSSMISAAQEDGLFLGRKDDTILAKEDWLIASAMVEKLIDFSRLQPNTNAIKGMTYTDSSENNFTMNFNLPNISNGQEFVDFLKTKKAQNIIQSYTTDAALGKNSLSKFKYK